MALQFTCQLNMESVQAMMHLIGRSRSSASSLRKPWVYVTTTLVWSFVVFLLLVNFPVILEYKMYAAVAVVTFLLTTLLFLWMHALSMRKLQREICPLVITCTLHDKGFTLEHTYARTEYDWNCFGKMIKSKKYCVLLYDKAEIFGLCFPLTQLNDDILMLFHSKIPEVLEV